MIAVVLGGLTARRMVTDAIARKTPGSEIHGDGLPNFYGSDYTFGVPDPRDLDLFTAQLICLPVLLVPGDPGSLLSATIFGLFVAARVATLDSAACSVVLPLLFGIKMFDIDVFLEDHGFEYRDATLLSLRKLPGTNLQSQPVVISQPFYDDGGIWAI